MLKAQESFQPPSQYPSVIAIPEAHLRSSIQVLNRVIVELRKIEMDIQKIALFEEPLEAIVHFSQPEAPEARPSWLQKMRLLKSQRMPAVRIKLNVTKAPHIQNIFLLKYETLPRDV